ncbi:MATE family efflux transporter [Natronomonas sp. CBA1123]|uniref:MATE family efflux transporter n=1 Tax=Natronomonas sp. CBA1123 TaxID=2668070 RepID=UPI0012EAEE39|nr:MATE family efflux transporter [Natronomonas sp. CBA1123]MUV86426.1 MATE family efflux transporter [Natronomonas sp. CBA1123]
MSRVPNPFRLAILAVGLLLARFGLIGEERARRTADLAWPRIVTGLARMSKNAVDVAMVGVAVGGGAIAGVGIAGPFWGLAFSIGGGVAGGTIALVSQRFGADAYEELGLAVRSSVFLVVAVSLPVVAVFWTYSAELIGLLSSDAETVRLGGEYLRVVALGVPFAGLNLVGSRVLVGSDDAYTAMVLRGGGAVANIVINAALIFGLGWGVVGAAVGTVLSNVGVTAAFAIGLTAGRFPGAGAFPVTIDPLGTYVDPATVADLVSIGLPVMGRNLVWTVAEFPMFAILDIFGQDVVSAFVIARRIWGLMNTPGWGFGLASSSLVGQELGTGAEETAEAYGREIIRYSVAVYIVFAAVVFVATEPIVTLFVADPTVPAVPIAVDLVRVACVAVVMQGVSGGAAGPLDAAGDTRWAFFSQALGMFGCSIPLVYLGATTSLGIYGLYLAFIAETTVPAALNYYRFATGKWKAVSREYRPETPAD